MTLSKFLLVALLSVCVIVISLSGVAGDKNQVVIKEKPRFELIDANSDGVITVEEAKDSWLATVFSKVDTNQDGQINRSEYEHA